ncbi:MAG TPA: chemotaxis response regulator protein-glutamate methylesterase [Thermoanaerobaculia bacterium]|nr:chemotaxis response regulator protein-glutamate methylesterase [Thermoanaerobaculia bacterium]
MINVLVIDDSAYNRVTLSRMLESHREVRVAATAVNGEDGIKQLLRHRPDVVTLDLEMPVLDGFAFLRWTMANHPTPVIAVSSKGSDRSVFKALELGALDFIAKPGGRISPRLPEIEADLVRKVLQVVEVRMDNLRRRVKEDERHEIAPVAMPAECAGGIDLVAIGCSTGGPPALQYLFEALPELPVPFVVAQHMPPNFTHLFAERINKLTRYEVKEAGDGEVLRPRTVYIAPGGRQMEVRRSGETLEAGILDAAEDELHAPSVDRLFGSASDACGERLVAVVLTGMGDDGAKSMRRVRERGGRTIAESAETAIIFGMPAEAIKTGSVEEILPLREIPAAVARICSGS